MARHLMNFRLGYTEETATGPKWVDLKIIKRATEAEAEAEVDSLYYASGYDLDGCKRHGVYIRRGSAKWFRRFSAHAGPGSSSPDYLK